MKLFYIKRYVSIVILNMVYCFVKFEVLWLCHPGALEFSKKKIVEFSFDFILTVRLLGK